MLTLLFAPTFENTSVMTCGNFIVHFLLLLTFLRLQKTIYNFMHPIMYRLTKSFVVLFKLKYVYCCYKYCVSYDCIFIIIFSMSVSLFFHLSNIAYSAKFDFISILLNSFSFSAIINDINAINCKLGSITVSSLVTTLCSLATHTVLSNH